MSGGPAASANDMGLAALLAEPRIATIGSPLFTDALRDQAAAVTPVTWRLPAVSSDTLDVIYSDPRRLAANATAVERMMTSRPTLVDILPAREALALEAGHLLHAGPPISWEAATGPLRGALAGALIYERQAHDYQEAEALLAGGHIELSPCHHHGAVGPMAGVISPSMPLVVIEDATHGGRAFCTFNEGLGRALRFGAFEPAVLDRLGWIENVLAPTLRSALASRGPIDLKVLIAQALQMGDEAHNRNRAGTSLFLREMVTDIVESGRPLSQIADVLRFIAGNDHFMLNLVMPACKAAADAARDIPGSTMVVAMARNGSEFGIQTAGTGDEWFTGPTSIPDGLYMGGYGPADASPDIGDSTITEVNGLGGFSMAAAPSIVAFVGGTVADAVAATQAMYVITMAEGTSYQIPALAFRGVPTGIDVTRVARTGLLPVVNTGIAGRVPGTGQVGAGVVRPPMEPFAAAARSLADRAQQALGNHQVVPA